MLRTGPPRLNCSDAAASRSLHASGVCEHATSPLCVHEKQEALQVKTYTRRLEPSMRVVMMCAQSKELQAGQYVLDSRYVRARFLSPYFAQFVTNVKEGAEVAARAPESPVTALPTEFQSAASASTSSD